MNSYQMYYGVKQIIIKDFWERERLSCILYSNTPLKVF